MGTFSERMRLAYRAIQTSSIDEPLKNGIWSVTYLLFWDSPDDWKHRGQSLLKQLWAFHFHQRLDECPVYQAPAVGQIKALYLAQNWHGVYDFVEFIATYDRAPNKTEAFTRMCNDMLVKHAAGYRLIGGKITPITSEDELESIGESIGQRGRFALSAEHLRTALARLSDRDSPDYRNSIKESISAVESVCQVITGDANATLDDALKRIGVHKALEKGFSAIYGYTNDAGGIRHALSGESDVDADDARFFLVACSSFVNYLISRLAVKSTA
jgi:AbiJ N-terminal domain 4